MKRRHFITAFGLLPPLLQSCLSDPIPPTIFTGIIVDENEKPVKDIDMYFGGNAGGFNPKSTFELRTKTDEKGYYYLEKIIPPETADVTFQPEGNTIYTNGLYDFLCLVNGVYQFEIPIVAQTKNELNFKIIKRK